MPAVTIVTADLAPFATIETARAQALINNAMARAGRVAPCIRDASLSEDNAEAAKGVLIDAILRKNDAGSGTVQSQQVGQVSQTMDTRQPYRVLLWPSEITELQAICRDQAGTTSVGAFSIDLTPSVVAWS